MPPELESGIERRLASPTEGATIRLIVGTEADLTNPAELLEGHVRDVHHELPLGYYSVTTTEDRLSELCELDFLTSIEVDSDATVFDSDFPSPNG